MPARPGDADFNLNKVTRLADLAYKVEESCDVERVATSKVSTTIFIRLMNLKTGRAPPFKEKYLFLQIQHRINRCHLTNWSEALIYCPVRGFVASLGNGLKNGNIKNDRGKTGWKTLTIFFNTIKFLFIILWQFIKKLTKLENSVM